MVAFEQSRDEMPRTVYGRQLVLAVNRSWIPYLMALNSNDEVK